MSVFVLVYFVALLAGAGLTWHWRERDGFIALVVLIVLSAVMWGVWGTSSIVGLAIVLAGIAAAALVGWVFRAALVAVLPDNPARFMKSAPLTASFGIFMVLVMAILAIFAQWIAPYGERTIVGDVWMPPSEAHLLGTDNLGRDMLSRLIFGAQTTIAVALAASMLAFAIGMFLSFTAATIGGWFDQVASRVEDMLLAIPTLIFALVVLAALPQNVFILVAVMAIIDQTRVFRLGRAVAMDIVVQDFVEAARLRGEGWNWIIFREVLPNVLTPLIAEFGLRFSFAILFLSTLSFLGLGIQPPEADWGGMVKDNKDGIIFLVPAALYPGAAIALLAVCVNMVVDWLLRRTASLRGGRGA
jgi:peptide/nickel transport system permease protein